MFDIYNDNDRSDCLTVTQQTTDAVPMVIRNMSKTKTLKQKGLLAL